MKINFIFYYVGIKFTDADSKFTDDDIIIHGINYSSIASKSYINMWTGEFMFNNKLNTKQKSQSKKYTHNIKWSNYNSPYIENV